MVKSCGESVEWRTIVTFWPAFTLSFFGEKAKLRASTLILVGLGLAAAPAVPLATPTPTSATNRKTANGYRASRDIDSERSDAAASSSTEDDEPALGHLVHRIVRAFARVPAVAQTAVGHLVGAVRGNFVHQDPAEVELARAPGARSTGRW